ncbi:pimeloyl-ACP methyl ester carboxylesterase [Curtobacterium sp. AG1037]|uniref:alpha/beta hydrolase n=1 Tax=Curtobacterium sp. AG1037 TaxID=2183990 RepID=UPI000E0C2DAE|nr:alpha/beta hydrolase [Curtobacterium sp. AG1037]RDI01015.1 pimeloyl-ACP methyl ester carboxylesterase [Curtobacterium sp. AG1037]
MTSTVVFVHGALVRDGAWWWQLTADLLLERTGSPSVAVALPSCGEVPGTPGSGRTDADLAADAAALRAVLDAHRDVVLVGHSYGGTVIAEAGTHPAVRHVVLVSSYTPPVGATQGSIMGAEPDPVAIRVEDGRIALDGYDVDTFGARFLQDGDAATQRDAFARTTTQAAAAFGTPTTRAGWADVPSTALVCTEDRSTTPGLQREHAARASDAVELPTGHHPFVTRPDLVVDVLAPLVA